jgi:hypothetical protein
VRVGLFSAISAPAESLSRARYTLHLVPGLQLAHLAADIFTIRYPQRFALGNFDAVSALQRLELIAFGRRFIVREALSETSKSRG